MSAGPNTENNPLPTIQSRSKQPTSDLPMLKPTQRVSGAIARLLHVSVVADQAVSRYADSDKPELPLHYCYFPY